MARDNRFKITVETERILIFATRSGTRRQVFDDGEPTGFDLSKPPGFIGGKARCIQATPPGLSSRLRSLLRRMLTGGRLPILPR